MGSAGAAATPTRDRIDRAAIGARILALPPIERDLAIRRLKLLQDAREKKGTNAHAKRDPAHRRRYVGDPWAYSADVFGLSFTAQQDEVLQLLLREARLLIPSGNNLGKTFIIAFWGLYRFDVLASIEGDGEAEQGARVLLPGPDHATIHATIYSEMMTLARRAELRGHLMPGERSEISVLWRVRPKWEIEAFSPPKQTTRNVAHTASGRHHANQCALIEEGQGVPEQVWKGAEGMCSSEGNQIVSSFNSTESIGPAFQRATNGTYAVIHLSAFKHPNIVERRSVIPSAVSLAITENRIRSDCRDRGAARLTPPEPEHLDFVYALPPAGADERGPRDDGILGHPDGDPRVYRPTAAFTGQVLGQWPADSDRGLFHPGEWDAGVQRSRAAAIPLGIPDGVGIDLAREGKDDTVGAPRWGVDASTLLKLYADAQLKGPAAVAALQETSRIRIGELRVFPKGDGPDTALALQRAYPDSPWAMDDGGVGASPFDHANRVLARDVIGVAFGSKPLPPLPGEPYCENMRTQLHVRAAMLVSRGLIDPPDDPILREEIMAQRVEYIRKTIERPKKGGGKEKVRVDAVQLIAKDTIKEEIGRSPNRSDAFVLSVFEAPQQKKRSHWVPASEAHINV
jgi:hypothetical protein